MANVIIILCTSSLLSKAPCELHVAVINYLWKNWRKWANQFSPWPKYCTVCCPHCLWCKVFMLFFPGYGATSNNQLTINPIKREKCLLWDLDPSPVSTSHDFVHTCFSNWKRYLTINYSSIIHVLGVKRKNICILLIGGKGWRLSL